MHSQFVGPSPLLAHVGRASNIILPLEQARRQNDSFGTVIIMMLGSIRPNNIIILLCGKNVNTM